MTCRPAHGAGGGVGAVGRVGNEDLGAGLAAGLVPSQDAEQAAEFALRTGRGLGGHGREAGDAGQQRFKLVYQLQRALGRFGGLVGMYVGQAGRACGPPR